MTQEFQYDENSIKSLNPLEHIRMRPGMYIGKLGNGEHNDDGIYVLFKEVIDNSILLTQHQITQQSRIGGFPIRPSTTTKEITHHA